MSQVFSAAPHVAGVFPLKGKKNSQKKFNIHKKKLKGKHLRKFNVEGYIKI